MTKFSMARVRRLLERDAQGYALNPAERLELTSAARTLSARLDALAVQDPVLAAQVSLGPALQAWAFEACGPRPA
ncbi:MAG: hypothetical protein R3F62_21890 [Planctomycetota bacterium]